MTVLASQVTAALRDPHDPQLHVLQPYNALEAISVKQAAFLAKRSPGTIRGWCACHQIGRRVGPGGWQVSIVALQMLLNNDFRTLKRYLAGDRDDPAVRGYFERAKLGHLLPKTGGGA